MFGISAVGWFHTFASLPAIPLAIYMFSRHGRILPNTRAGIVYLVSMAIGAGSVYAIADAPESYVIATLTLLALAVGYGVARLPSRGRWLQAIERGSLTVSALLLLIPTVTEILTRVPHGAPWAAGVDAPIVVAAQAGIFIVFVMVLAMQLFVLFRRPA